MTNKEAIDYLKGVCQTITLESVCPFGYYSDSVPYIDQAIKALEREEVCKNIAQFENLKFRCSECGAELDDITISVGLDVHHVNYCPNCGRKIVP